MAFRISRQHAEQLSLRAGQAGEQECCGLLFGSGGRIAEVLLTGNVASVPSNSFEIDPAALIAAEKQARQGGPAILGYFHSHPNGLAHPSFKDEQSAADNGRLWLIIAQGAITAWLPVVSPLNSVRFERVELVVEG